MVLQVLTRLVPQMDEETVKRRVWRPYTIAWKIGTKIRGNFRWPFVRLYTDLFTFLNIYQPEVVGNRSSITVGTFAMHVLLLLLFALLSLGRNGLSQH